MPDPVFENPRVGGSIPSPATIFLRINKGLRVGASPFVLPAIRGAPLWHDYGTTRWRPRRSATRRQAR
jgi:hypothetical protein